MPAGTRSRRALRLASLTALLLLTLLLGGIPTAALRHPGRSTRADAASAYGKLPLSFELNQGQAANGVDVLTHTGGGTLALSGGDAALLLPAGKPAAPELAGPQAPPAVLGWQLLGANHPRPVQEQQQAGTVNYFLGNDPSRWRTGIPTFAQVRYPSVYPGVDVVYYGTDSRLEYDFKLAAGADPAAIRLRYSGAQSLSLSDAGELVLQTPRGELRQPSPVSYQDIGGQRRPVDVHYRLQGDEIMLQAGRYDATRPLVIDPVLVYSTYLGGTGADQANGIAVDGSGNAYIAGQTQSTDFPTHSPLQATNHGGVDAFVAKLNAAGTALVYSTYLGGSGNDQANGIAVDGSGNAYITGQTQSTDFPTHSPLQATNHGVNTAFIAKLNAAGSALVYSTYLGGSNGDFAYGIAIDSSGNAYVAGFTFSSDFPTQSPLQSTNNGFTYTAFVAKLNAAGSALVYSTYLGGTGNDIAYGIAVDSSGNAYIAGTTTSADFPTQSPLQVANHGNGDAFVTKLNAAGSALVYSTFLGGAGNDYAYGIAVDGSGNAYVAGQTKSTDFPTQSSFQVTNHGGNGDAFVAKVNAAGAALVFSTYLGGSDYDIAYAIAVDGSGNAYVTGNTASTDFPTQNPLQAANHGGGDAFVTKLNPAGSPPVYSTYLGGSGGDGAKGIAVDGSGNAYVAGDTSSTDFPTQSPLQATNHGGTDDAFVAKLLTPVAATLTNPAPGTKQLSYSTVNFQWTAGNGVSQYDLLVGGNTWQATYAHSGPITATSYQVSGLPSGPNEVDVRLYSRIGGTWQSIDYVFRAYPGLPASMTSPPNNATFTGSSVTFQWSAGDRVSQYWLDIGTQYAGSKEVYDQNQGTGQSVTVNNLPQGGGRLYVRLWSRVSGDWQYTDTWYTEAGAAQPATITSPTSGTALPSSTTFQWNAGQGAADYELWVGDTGPTSYNLYRQYQGPNLSATVNNIPQHGGGVYVTLWSYINEVWQKSSALFAEQGTAVPAAMTSPAANSTLAGSSQQFQWTPGSGVTWYYFRVGTVYRGTDIYNGYQGQNTSKTVSGIPTGSKPIFVTLWSYIDGAYQAADYQYTGPP